VHFLRAVEARSEIYCLVPRAHLAKSPKNRLPRKSPEANRAGMRGTNKTIVVPGIIKNNLFNESHSRGQQHQPASQNPPAALAIKLPAELLESVRPSISPSSRQLLQHQHFHQRERERAAFAHSVKEQKQNRVRSSSNWCVTFRGFFRLAVRFSFLLILFFLKFKFTVCK
jgi:hypothetical protein